MERGVRPHVRSQRSGARRPADPGQRPDRMGLQLGSRGGAAVGRIGRRTDIQLRLLLQLPMSWPDGFFRFIFKREFHRIPDPVTCARGSFLFSQIMYRLIVEPVNALYHGWADSSKM